jgi:hypothetical protein
VPQPFFERLRTYYESVASVLRGEADAAAVFPNPTDRGAVRERIYLEFLKQHAPSKCNVFVGGFLFDEEGAESKQLDILVTTDTAPQFNFANHDGGGRSFTPVEGTIAAVSVKSNLDRAELHDALAGLASIPPTRPLGDRKNPVINIPEYEDWPLKIIYAAKGIRADTLLSHINGYYAEHPEIPQSRRADIIHVAGSCLIVRIVSGMKVLYRETGAETQHEIGSYHLFVDDLDISAISLVLGAIQQRVSSSTHILFNYGFIKRGILRL